MKKLTVEFIGTFFLVLTIAIAAVAGTAGALAPVAIAATLLVVLYAGGPVSGGHYNPAVTLAVLVRGKIGASEAVGYVAAQILAAVAASFVGGAIHGPTGSAIVHSTLPTLLAEFFYTFLLTYVVLGVATTKKSAGNQYFGLAIAFCVLAGAFAVGGISGGAFNPAVAVGLAVMGKTTIPELWLYFVPNLLAGALAGVVTNWIQSDEA